MIIGNNSQHISIVKEGILPIPYVATKSSEMNRDDKIVLNEQFMNVNIIGSTIVTSHSKVYRLVEEGKFVGIVDYCCHHVDSLDVEGVSHVEGKNVHENWSIELTRICEDLIRIKVSNSTAKIEERCYVVPNKVDGVLWDHIGKALLISMCIYKSPFNLVLSHRYNLGLVADVVDFGVWVLRDVTISELAAKNCH